MANELKSYIEKYIFNSESSSYIGEDGDEDTQAKIEACDETKGEVLVSKLRSQNASKLADRNRKYKDKQVSRKSLSKKGDEDDIYDPELSKMILITESDDDQINSGSECKDDDESGKISVDEDDEWDRVDENAEESDEFEDDKNEGSSNFIGIGDEDELNVEPLLKLPSVQTFNREDTEFNCKALAVKHQFGLSDSIFEMRIGLQKALTSSNRLPQTDKFKQFCTATDEYKKSLQKSRSDAKKLLTQLVELQDEMLANNPETRKILEAGSLNSILNSTSKNEEEEKNSAEHRKSKKRKVEQFEDLLSNRNAAFVPYRDDTLTRWHDRSQMLRPSKSSANFSGFESSAVKQLEDILSNHDQLLRRTRLVSIERGNQMDILGKTTKEGEDNLRNYDPEIFDDTDFYSQQLEYILKSKMSSNSNNSNIAESLENVLALRRRTRKKVVPRSSKLRRLKYEVMSLMQNYLAPCKFPSLSDNAMDKLFSSLFGRSLQNNVMKENKIT